MTVLTAFLFLISFAFVDMIGYGASDKTQFNLLSAFIESEASEQPFDCKVAVASVVLNRVDNPMFPNTIPAVIFQPGAFAKVAQGKFLNKATYTSKRAAEFALAGFDPSQGALIYWDPRKTLVGFRWSRKVTHVIGTFFFGP
jgi:N-acetylmuramoyl-L-alanine amidase